MTTYNCQSTHLGTKKLSRIQTLFFSCSNQHFICTIDASVVIPSLGCIFDRNPLEKCRFVERFTPFFLSLRTEVVNRVTTHHSLLYGVRFLKQASNSTARPSLKSNPLYTGLVVSGTLSSIRMNKAESFALSTLMDL